MSSDQILTLIVAFLGIAGTGLSTLLAARLSRRADAERAQRELQAKREELLFETRRKLFGEYLQAVERVRELIKDFSSTPRSAALDETLDKLGREFEDRLYILETDLRLVSPGIQEHLSAIRRAASAVRHLTPRSREDLEEAARLDAEISTQKQLAIQSMQTMLGISKT